MKNCLWLARFYTGKRRPVGWRFTGTALVLQFLALIFDDYPYRLIAHGVVRVFIDHGIDLYRTCRYAVTTTITLICIDRNEIVTGRVFVSVIS
jgi:hypothetical protein